MRSIITGAARRRARRLGVVKLPPLDLSAEQVAALLAELTRDAAPALAELERLAAEGVTDVVTPVVTPVVTGDEPRR